MLPGNVDPRRPDKVQRYVSKTPTASGNNGQEDLTTDYMNILGPHQTTANAPEASDKHAESSVGSEPNSQLRPSLEDVQQVTDELAVATSMIPTSPQYGVAIIPNSTTNASELQPDITSLTETITDTSIKPPDDSKDLHSTPSRNDRFKVVKIASLEPFKRGRWKCMDYVDEAPPPVNQSKVAQSSTGSIQVAATGVYLQTQSLPQHQIQQMLLQSGFTNGTQFFHNVPAQMIPPGQYFYPQINTIQNQNLPQQVPSSMPAQFMNSGQTYFPAGVIPNATGFTVPQGYTNVQYVPANLIQNQNSAFVPTSQTVQLPANFQQSQTYAGQPNATQSNVVQPLVNGHSYPQQQNEQQVTSNSLPTQTAKSVILNSNGPQPVVSQNQINQQSVQNHVPVQASNQTQSIPSIQNQQYQNPAFQQQSVANQPSQSQNSNNPVQTTTPNTTVVPPASIIQVSQMMPSQSFEPSLANNVYTNPQFTMSVNSLTVLENTEPSAEVVTETNSGADTTNESSDDLAKTNPVVNAIDNKIEQAMDLVKSHLMYTVREEVEVLKEKITELLDRIQQLETENNFLRSQIPKSQTVATTSNVTPTSNVNTTSTQSNVPVVNPSPNIMTQTTAPQTVTPSLNNPVSNTQNPTAQPPNESTPTQL